MKKALIVAGMALALSPFIAVPALAGEPFLLPFFPTPLAPSRTPLAFGMTVQDAANALEMPLTYVSGSKGNEVFAASLPGGQLFPRSDKIYLQFRKGKLTGWKGDWSIAWVGP